VRHSYAGTGLALTQHNAALNRKPVAADRYDADGRRVGWSRAAVLSRALRSQDWRLRYGFGRCRGVLHPPRRLTDRSIDKFLNLRGGTVRIEIVMPPIGKTNEALGFIRQRKQPLAETDCDAGILLAVQHEQGCRHLANALVGTELIFHQPSNRHERKDGSGHI
jgi:hypothetical protein